MRVILSLVGLPGAGKSTVATAISASLGLPALSTGESLRRVAQSDPALANALAKGQLGPEDLVKRFVEDYLWQHPIAILDGYPRHGEQAKYLLARSERLIVAHLAIDPAVALERIRMRTARADDSDAAIMQRFARDTPAIDDVIRILQSSVVRCDGSAKPTLTAATLVTLAAHASALPG